jgi:hypothetical protein
MTDYFDPGREREFYTYITLPNPIQSSLCRRYSAFVPDYLGTHTSSPMQILRRLSRNLSLRPAFHRPVRCRGGGEA